MTLVDKSFDEVCKLQGEIFSMEFLTCDFKEKIALVSMVCYLTNELNKKRDKEHKITCYDVLFKIDTTASKNYREDFLKGLAALCQDFMKGSTNFETFGIPPKEMPNMIRRILDSFLPF